MSDIKSNDKSVKETLNKQYIDTKINPIVEPMVIALMKDDEGAK